MIFHRSCSLKINLSLSVFGRRADGYHDISSLFMRFRSPESLVIDTEALRDSVCVLGAEVQGENIVARAVSSLRRAHPDRIPPAISVCIHKQIPAGTGLGAGSGDAAALIDWARIDRGIDVDDSLAASLGADVAFLASDFAAAHAEGIGDVLEDAGSAPEVDAAIFFPEWRSSTPAAYAELDALRASGDIEVPRLSLDEARRRSDDSIAALRCGKVVGLLTNDFLVPALAKHPCMADLFSLAERSGALAWGMCGSGSSLFALFERGSKKIAPLIGEIRGGGHGWIKEMFTTSS